MRVLNVFQVVGIMLISSAASAHDSYTHKAPLQACSEKQKSDDCSYNNGKGDLYKGSCQLFSEALMCVRNEPIIYFKDLSEEAKKKFKDKDAEATHTHD